jgi:hypothetical protein
MGSQGLIVNPSKVELWARTLSRSKLNRAVIWRDEAAMTPHAASGVPSCLMSWMASRGYVEIAPHIAPGTLWWN